MPPPVPIPADVQLWLLDVFRGCNERVSGIVSTVPNTWETSLDMSFIESFHSVSAPHLFPSGWTVDLSTHYLGSGRHWPEWEPWPRRWEIADIGFLVQFRQGGKLVRSKVALLQSKRLYPDELVHINEDTAIDYWRGFSRLFQRDDEWAEVIAPRPFTFTEQSRYRTLTAGNDQYRAIAGYEQQRQVPVYYMLYNPLGVPSTTVLPLRPNDKPTDACDVGCRVVPASQLRALMGAEPEGSNPSFGQLAASLSAPFDAVEHRAGWRLEHFVVNLLLDCAGGYIADSPSDGGLNYIFNRRSAPISAALALTLDAP